VKVAAQIAFCNWCPLDQAAGKNTAQALQPLILVVVRSEPHELPTPVYPSASFSTHDVLQRVSWVHPKVKPLTEKRRD